MRSPSALSLLATILLSGCTSSSVDVLALQRPSAEMTSSVVPDAPLPAGPVPSGDVGYRLPGETVAALAAEPDRPAERAVAAVDTTDAPPTALPATKVALLVPDRPAVRPDPVFDGAIRRHRFRDAKPINFGARSPRKLAVHGVDVSRWQGDIDWVRLRSQGANFAYIKATDGGDHLDPMFRTNWRKAGEAGLKRGAYHFFYWCRVASDQADWFIRNVPKVAGALPPVIDVEWNGESRCRKRPSPAKVREKMQVFMDRLESHYGQRPIIYTAPDFYRDNLKGAFQDYPFWLRAVAEHPSKVYPNRDWVFWQYSGSGLSHGVSGKIDLNVFHGSESQWRKWVSRHAG